MLKIKIFFYAIRPYQYFFRIYWLMCGDLITSKLLGLSQKQNDKKLLYSQTMFKNHHKFLKIICSYVTRYLSVPKDFAKR